MIAADADRRALDTLDLQLKIVLPEDYQASYEALEPTPMRSAGLKFDPDGQVAWDKIWGSFCDLAMAGGPPHKGALLAPGRSADVTADPARYDAVVDEICRGITMTTDLFAVASPDPGWVRVDCLSDTMAAWLVRAITMENVAARIDGRALELPAAPHFRVEKEIKNVITVLAKTCHYWIGHMPRTQKESIAILFASLDAASPLVSPLWGEDDFPPGSRNDFVAAIAGRIPPGDGIAAVNDVAPGWIAVDVTSVPAAVWMMRAVVMRNVLARREHTALCLPLNPRLDPNGDRIVGALAWSQRLARARGVL